MLHYLEGYYWQRVSQRAQAVSILRLAVEVSEGSSRLVILSGGPSLSLFDMLVSTGRGFRNLMFPLWFALVVGFFVFLEVGSSILFIVLPLFWVL